jgi:hypothetical protein
VLVALDEDTLGDLEPVGVVVVRLRRHAGAGLLLQHEEPLAVRRPGDAAPVDREQVQPPAADLLHLADDLDERRPEWRAGGPPRRGEPEHEGRVDGGGGLRDVEGPFVERAAGAVPVGDAAVVAEEPPSLGVRRDDGLVVRERRRVRADRAEDAAARDRRGEAGERCVRPDRLRAAVADRLVPAEGVPPGSEAVGVDDTVELGPGRPGLGADRAGRVEQQRLEGDRLAHVGEVT